VVLALAPDQADFPALPGQAKRHQPDHVRPLSGKAVERQGRRAARSSTSEVGVDEQVPASLAEQLCDEHACVRLDDY